MMRISPMHSLSSRLHLTIIVCCIAVGGFNIANAVLAPKLLSDLIDDSDLILVGRTVSATFDDGQAGHAHLRIKAVIKGEYATELLTIRWSARTHEQRIDRLGQERLLFLRRNAAGGYSGTQYGRSYWPLYVELDTFTQVTPYIYPTDLVELDIPDLLRDARIVIRGLPIGKEVVPLKAVYLDDIVNVIADKGTK